MKKMIFLGFAITGLIAMSFKTITPNKVGVIKTTMGYQLTNINKLSLEDLKKLKEKTILGAAETTFVNTQVYKNAVNKTVYVTTPQDPNVNKKATNIKKIKTSFMSSSDQEMLNEILNKYED